MSKKNLMTASFLLLSGLSYANYNVIILKEKNDYVEPEWFTYNDYSEWKNTGYPYNCVEEFSYVETSVFRKETCDQDQERTYDEYLKEKHSGKKELISSGNKETQTIVEIEDSEVGSAVIESQSGSFEIAEGNSGTTSEIDLKIVLNKPLDFPVTYSYNTQDVTTSSILDKAENLVYDEFGNPFISVVDNVGGGKLIFDGGFPKYYNGNWNNAKTFNELPIQFKFMHNIVKWIGETHKSRGKVLVYGDAVENHSYSVHETASSDFLYSIPGAISIAGFTPVVKSAVHPDFGGSRLNNVKVDISLEELNKYSAVVLMSSGGWESLNAESVNNFTTYVNNGGGVYIITDHDYFQPTGNQILRKFGSEFYGIVNRTSTHEAYKLSTIWGNLVNTDYGQSHELWNGLNGTDSIPANGSEGNVRLFTPQTDIIAQSGVITFSAGETEKYISIKINGDNTKEDDEVFKVMLQSGDNTGHIDPNSAGREITVLNDD